ncbi:DUF726-domain-containing protein [Linderina pennispora]|uniref:DUF726-domain-containing protein n=1 Tax=Linderina pennispora TaxID=61395 RepID=A0A1Y1W1E3_9FUNG|nr:DUF726-domain-containing protein [Linderina pennispora]ORX67125.1 DUF726-domain-containing protein [Linderina pennispora]
MPVPLGSVPTALAHRVDRRRDYYTDSQTLGAAMGAAAPTNTGIRYSTSERPDSTTIEPGKRSPAFRRAPGKSPGGYGAESHLPRFMVDRMLRESEKPESMSGRTSVASARSQSSAGSPKPNQQASMRSILEIEEAKLLAAERQNQLHASDGILSEEQKVAYVGLVYLLLVDMQDRLNVQFKESQSSTASFMNFSRRVMRKMYRHVSISLEEQRMIDMLPRHKIQIEDMAASLAAQGDTIIVEADQELAVAHLATDDLVHDLKPTRDSAEEEREDKKKRKNKLGLSWMGSGSLENTDDEDSDMYSQYSMLPTDAPDRQSLDGAEKQKRSFDSDVSEKQLPEPANTSSEQPAARISVGSDSAGLSGRETSGETVQTDTDDAVPPYVSMFCSEPQTPISPMPPSINDLDDETLTKVDVDQTLVIDVRATLILDLFLLLLTDDVYDSRSRYLLRRMAEAIGYPWVEVMKCERRVTRQLCLHEYATDVRVATKDSSKSVLKEHASKGKKKRLMIIGLATVGGGLVIGLSAGLLAPAIGAGIGATLGAIGVANTGTALITGAATLTGSGLAGRQITRRTRFAEQFEFIPCISEQQTNLILTADNGVFSFSTLDPLNGDHCSLLWDSLRMIVGETLQHTVLPSLLGPLSIPMWLAKLGYVLDNPWSTGCDMAEKAGPRVQGQRPVTLVGYSIGARLIFYALLELARMNAFGLVEDVYLFGAPVVESSEEWRRAASVIGGRFDWILSFFYRTTSLGRNSIAGLHPITGLLMPRLMSKQGIRTMIEELEKAAELLEAHDKKKKKWIQKLTFWDSGSSSSTRRGSVSSSDSPPATELGIQVKEVEATLPALSKNVE